MALPLVPIAAQIARVIASKGIKAAIKKFGKETVKKNAKNVPQLVRAKKIKESTKEAERIRKIKLPRGGKGAYNPPKSSTRSQAGTRRAKKIKAEIARGERPDRMSILGKRGYNFNRGGEVGRLIEKGPRKVPNPRGEGTRMETGPRKMPNPRGRGTRMDKGPRKMTPLAGRLAKRGYGISR